MPARCNPAGERMERQSGGLLPKAERYERVNRNEQCDRSKGAVRRLRLRNANRKKAENPQEKQNPGSIDLQCPGESKWRDSKRNLNRRCSRLERARRSFRLIRSPLFAFSDAPQGRRSACSPTAFSSPRVQLPAFRLAKPRSTHEGHFGVLCRSGGIRTRGLLVPNQTRYQTALHLEA